MKNKIALITFACLALAAAIPAKAQTFSETNFISSAQTYFTSFNTNYSWSAVSWELATGYKQVTGVGAANDLMGQHDFDLFGTTGHVINAGADLQFSGVGSPVNSAQAQLGYAIVEHYDVKADFDLRPGYDWTRGSPEIEPGLFLKKLQTDNTATELGVSLPVYFKGRFSKTPDFFVEEVIKF
jgi:opacity protein-like surface antigen